MNLLDNIIEHCHHRHQNPLRQRKTITIPAVYFYNGAPYNFTVYCAHRQSILLNDLEDANISFMPIGRAPHYDHGPRTFGNERFLKRQTIQDWHTRRWQVSWGIQIYTGIPSGTDGAHWHDIEFKYETICAAPDAVFTCISELVNAVENPLLTMTKDGGLRFSCRIADYLHPNTELERLYIYKDTLTSENLQQREVYLTIFGEEGYNTWDARFEILLGNLLDPPLTVKKEIFVPINALRVVLHAPAGKQLKRTATTVPLTLGSHNLDLAKEAFVTRCFSYVRQHNNIHYWTRHTETDSEENALLWECHGVVWVRAATPNAELPTISTQITDIWDNTSILPQIPATGLVESDKALAIREGKLSPLAIRRSPPVLHKSEHIQQTYSSTVKNAVQIQHCFDQDVRILGSITEPTVGYNAEVVSELLDSGSTCINVPNTALVEEIEQYYQQHYQKQNLPPVTHYKPRNHLWELVENIPIKVRIEKPFQHGNMCEDAERCDALEKKGGNPSESICPQCPVYAVCQERGFLSQFSALQQANIQISDIPNLFFDPQYTEIVKKMLKHETTERLCIVIVNDVSITDLFVKCELSKDILEKWSLQWQGDVLGNFAKVLLNLLTIKCKSHRDAVNLIRTAVQAFELQKEKLIQQMCQVNVRGRVVKRGTVDSENGKELARFSIDFEGGTSVYIPLDNNTADKLEANGLPFFLLKSFRPNEDIRIPMSITQAIRLGILDVETIESIHNFPTVYPNPNWTFWHQLKCFFDYYTRDADAPIRLNNNSLLFKIPPRLHEHVKRLLLLSSTISEPHFRKAFSDEKIELFRHETLPWGAGNRIFQIRTKMYPPETILDYDNDWNSIRVSNTAQRFVSGIRAEIEREPNVNHAIITVRNITALFEDVVEKENVCSVTYFTNIKEMVDSFEDAQVVWILGAPIRSINLLLWRAQLLFGDDKKPLSYERDMKSECYTDERLMDIYEEVVVRKLTEIVKHVRLTHSTDKKIVLISAMALPDITDRPETLLFDWEDFEIAGGLHKLAETITTREHFETEKTNLTAESGREKVQQVLGCSAVHANRILNKLRGGNILRVSFQDQIISLLADGEKKAIELIEAIEGHPTSVRNELKRLVDIGEIVKVRRGVYALP